MRISRRPLALDRAVSLGPLAGRSPRVHRGVPPRHLQPRHADPRWQPFLHCMGLAWTVDAAYNGSGSSPPTKINAMFSFVKTVV